MWWRIWNGGTSTGEVTIHGEQKIFSFTSNPATCFGSRFHQQFVMSPDSTLTRLIERTASFPTRYWFFEAVTCSTRLDKKGRCAGWLRWLGPQGELGGWKPVRKHENLPPQLDIRAHSSMTTRPFRLISSLRYLLGSWWGGHWLSRLESL